MKLIKTLAAATAFAGLMISGVARADSDEGPAAYAKALNGKHVVMVPLAMGLLMYLTPVVFPVPQQGWVATVYLWNPLTPLITTSRDWLTGFAPDQLGYFLGVNVVAFAALLFAWVAWRISMPIIIERMSA